MEEVWEKWRKRGGEAKGWQQKKKKGMLALLHWGCSHSSSLLKDLQVRAVYHIRETLPHPSMNMQPPHTHTHTLLPPLSLNTQNSCQLPLNSSIGSVSMSWIYSVHLCISLFAKFSCINIQYFSFLYLLNKPHHIQGLFWILNSNRKLHSKTQWNWILKIPFAHLCIISSLFAFSSHFSLHFLL